MRLLHFFLILATLSGCKQKQSPKQKAGFEKIIFHTSSCFGTCPTYHLEINNDKKVRLHAEHVYKQPHDNEPYTTRMGYFEGSIGDRKFEVEGTGEGITVPSKQDPQPPH